MNSKPLKTAEEVLQEALRSRGVRFEVLKDDLYRIYRGQSPQDNNVRELLQHYESTGDPSLISAFVESMLQSDSGVAPSSEQQIGCSGASMDLFTSVDVGVSGTVELGEAYFCEPNSPLPEFDDSEIEAVMQRVSQEGFLQDAFWVPLQTNSIQAIFVGIYGRRFFESLQEFAQFTSSLNAATQDWYHTKDLRYVRGGVGFGDDWPFDSTVHKGRGMIRELLRERRFSIDINRIPDLCADQLEWTGDDDDFTAVARCEDCWLHIFLADRVD